MKKYSIEIDYNFRDVNEKEDLELQFDDIEVAKANALRIVEHYDFYKSLREIYTKPGKTAEEKDKEAESIFNKNSSKDWFYKSENCGKICDSLYLILYADDGSPEFTVPFWASSFETLNKVTVKLSDKNLEFFPSSR